MSGARTAASTRASLRSRLLWLVLAAIGAATLVQAVTVYRFSLHEADRMFDAHLQEVARSIQGGGPFTPLEEESGYSVQIWGPDGTELYRSGGSRLPSQAVLGFSDAVIGGTRLRIYTLQTRERVVQIAQDLDARGARARELALRAVLPVLLVAPALMLLAGWAIARALRPLARIRRQVAGRAALDLTPIAVQDAPAEVEPLVAELNALFVRVHAAVDAQQRFVADAAHELRSPLTALKLQVQAARRAQAAQDAHAAEAALAQLTQGIDRGIAVVEQLLALAREEARAQGTDAPRAAPPAQAQPLDVEEAARETVSALFAAAEARRQELSYEGAPGLRVRADAESLQLILRNLVDNAVKYTPEGGRIEIGAVREDAAGGAPWVRITVEDSGPGIPAAERARVFDRFYRAGDAAAQPGSGLGLAIVRAVAARLGGEVQLGDSARLGGCSATVRLPAAG